jgi:hypothetical protein
LLLQVGDLFELNVKLRWQKVNDCKVMAYYLGVVMSDKGILAILALWL